MPQQIKVPEKIIYTREDGTRDVFIVHEKLGQGGFALVHRVTHTNSNKTFAMKIIPKERHQSDDYQKYINQIKNEIEIQKDLNHPNIVKSKLTFSDDTNQYIVLEYCPGKTIRDYIKKKEQGYLSEPETRQILNDVIQGLIHLHKHKIIHHDLKLENFLIGANGRVKIADFGVSVVLKNSDDKNKSFCGTSSYLSPEVLMKESNGHSFEVDIWAIGVCAFIMLTGQPPFCGFEKEFIYEKIKNNEYNFPPSIPLSKEAKGFIRRIFQVDPRRRPTAIELVDHPFLTEYDKEQVKLYVQPKFIPSLNNNLILKSNSPFRSVKRIGCSNLRGSNVPFYSSKNSDETSSSSKKLSMSSSIPNSNENSQSNCNKYIINAKKTFTVPKHFVVKHFFIANDLGYLLGDGTVGVCFEDGSRIVLDPYEKFVQVFKDNDSYADAIELNHIVENKYQSKISLVQKFANSFKKFRFLYELTGYNYDCLVPLYHIKSFMKKNDSILFKFNDNNIQINFEDHKKLIIFSNLKKMCLVSHLKEKCSFVDIKDAINNDSSDESRKYGRAKEMFTELHF
ncbi:hypothetical protein M9Y10_015973 [Tritrichomonas musculus]|uniref:Protein kinase domain-containing protein n=1 Tax=Tritrichomonas musculus TaxID=1915356 RepID=A0ABR2I6E1_9EUKA